MTDTNDAYEIFLSLDDVNDVGFSKETKEALNAEHEAIKAEREEAKADSWESELDDSNDEVEQYEFDESLYEDDDGNPIFEDIEVVDEEVSPEEEITTSEDGDEEYGDDGGIYDVDEDTTLTLPDGRVMSIGELQQKALEGEALEERERQIKQKVKDFESRYEAAKDTLSIAQLEADRLIDSYAGYDWDAYYEEDPVNFAADKRYYDKLVKRKADLINQQAKIKSQQEAEKEEAFKRESLACVQILKHVIPNWNDKLYENLMNFAVTHYGADPEEILTWNKPVQFMMLHDGYVKHNGIQKAKASLKGAKKGGKFLSSNGNQTKASKEAQQEKAARLFAAGKISNQDAFAFLTD